MTDPAAPAPQAICVYAGSSGAVSPAYRQAATALGRGLAEAGEEIVYGGGRVGLMGLLADAALAAGGRVTGIIPEHIRAREVDHAGLTELLVVDSMHTRKRLMAERSRAFVVLPGGLGTLDETLEIVTWRQLGLHDRPVLLLNVDGYWDTLLALLRHTVAAGFAPETSLAYFTVVETVDAALAALDVVPLPARAVATGRL